MRHPITATLLLAALLSTPHTQPASATEPVESGRTGTVLIDPIRLADTRLQGHTVDGISSGTGTVAAGTVVEIPIAGRGPIPPSATGVIATITAANPTDAGYLTVSDCGTRPPVSDVTYAAGQPTGTTVLAELSTDGRLCVYTLANTDVVVDITGYLDHASDIIATTPRRLADTRTTPSGAGGQRVGADETISVAVPRTPLGGNAAVLTVTVTEPANNGYLTIYPCNEPRPVTSPLTYPAGATVTNTVIAGLDPQHRTCIYTHAATHLIVDHRADIVTGRTLHPVSPARIADTRTNHHTIDHQQQGGGTLPGEHTLDLTVATRAGIPAHATAAVLTVTVTEPQAPGYITTHRCDQPTPHTSSLNYLTGQTVTATIVAPVGPDGHTCLSTHADTHLVVDAVAYLTADRPTLAAGGNHTCAINRSHRIRCWGNNQTGQLGNGTYATTGTGEVAGIHTAIAITAGGAHTCTLTTSLAVSCWGDNSHHQLALTDPNPTAIPHAVPLPQPVTAIAAGDHHTCALSTDTTVWCWGDNTNSQLGLPPNQPHNTPAPTRITGLEPVIAIAAGGDTTCALATTGRVACWGSINGHATPEPQPVPDLTDATAISVGYHHACAITRTAGVVCWGDNTHHQLGTPTPADTNTPIPVPGLPPVARINTGSGNHTCAITTTGTASCWGQNTHGQASPGADPQPPTPIGATTATDITTGDHHTCARQPSGHITCWGNNTFNQTGGTPDQTGGASRTRP